MSKKLKVVIPVNAVVNIPIHMKVMVEYTGTEEEIKRLYDELNGGENLLGVKQKTKVNFSDIEYDDNSDDIIEAAEQCSLSDLKDPTVADELENILDGAKEV